MPIYSMCAAGCCAAAGTRKPIWTSSVVCGNRDRIRNTVETFLEETNAELVDLFPVATPEVARKRWRRYRVDDVVNCIALWIMDENFHQKFGNLLIRDKFFDKARIKRGEFAGHATNDEELELDGKFSIQSLGFALGLIPQIEPWVTAPEANPHEEVLQSKLNARLIYRIGRIKFRWTFNLTEHLRLDNGVLSLFCMPCRLMLQPSSSEVENNSPDLALS
jgi:hypothetical protein